MAKINFQEIVAQVLNGDTNAYDQLIEALTYKMLRYAESITHDQSKAEEAVQEAFIDCYLHLPSLRDPDAFEGFLAINVKRKCFRRFSDFDYEDILEYADYLSAKEELPEDYLIRKEEQSVVRAAIEKLPPAQKAVTKLFYLDGCSVKETAETLKIPEGTVKRRLHDAREKLQKELNAFMNNNKVPIIIKEFEEKIKEIKKYKSLYGEDDTFSKNADELSSLITNVDDKRLQKYYKAELYALTPHENLQNREEIRDEYDRIAEEGEHPMIMARQFFKHCYDLCKNGDDLPMDRAEYLEKTALSALEKCRDLPGYEKAVGYLLCQISRFIADYDFDRAIKLLKQALDFFGEDDFYKTAVRTALQTYKESCRLSSLPDMGMIDHVCRLGVSQKGIRISDEACCYILNRPITHEHTFSPFFVYYLQDEDMMLLNADVKPGFVRESQWVDPENENNTVHKEVSCLSDSDSVSVPAGVFENCTHMRKKRRSECRPSYMETSVEDVWFKDGIGVTRYSYSSEGNTETYELTEYALSGGEGMLPLAAGNHWIYREVGLPKALESRHEYRVSHVTSDGAFYDLSHIGLTYIPKAEDRGINIPDSDVCLAIVDKLCERSKFDEALAYLRAAIRANTSEKAVAAAVYGVPLMEKYADYQKSGYRFLPGHIRSRSVAADIHSVTETNSQDYFFSIGRFGSRGKYEDRIFGVKPFTYLDLFTGHYWSTEWKPGYKKEIPFEDWNRNKATVLMAAEDGGTVTLPCGTFENCIKVTLDAEIDGERADDYYLNWDDGYQFFWCGKKEYWFAPGVGIVRFICTWGNHVSSEMILNSYAVPGSDGKEYLPIHIGTRWEYVETHLTDEGYRAAFCVCIPNGIDGKYQWIQSQEFVYLGTAEEYDNRFFNE